MAHAVSQLARNVITIQFIQDDFMFIFVFFAFAASFAIFHVGKHWLKTPYATNVLGAICVWAAVFSLGGALGGAGQWSSGVDGEIDTRPYAAAAIYLALALLAYGGSHLLQRAIARRQERVGRD